MGYNSAALVRDELRNDVNHTPCRAERNGTCTHTPFSPARRHMPPRRTSLPNGVASLNFLTATGLPVARCTQRQTDPYAPSAIFSKTS